MGWMEAAKMGSKIASPIIGGAANAVGNYYGQKYEQRGLNNLKSGVNESSQIGQNAINANVSDWQQYADPYAQDIANTRQGLAGYDQQMEQFDPNQYKVEDFLNPNMDYQQSQMQKGLEQSAINSGAINSGATAKAILNQRSQMAQSAWNEAFNQKQNQQQFGYNQMRDRSNFNRENALQKLNNLQGISNISGNARENVLTGNMDLAQLQGNTASQLANISAQKNFSRGDYMSGQARNFGTTAQQGLGAIAGSQKVGM